MFKADWVWRGIVGYKVEYGEEPGVEGQGGAVRLSMYVVVPDASGLGVKEKRQRAG